ncbi:hypothetical protein Pelo_18627 [Pelomyxa schiedti]|nr:hypothetical protein Pelo_18627 [Pelomyxa schiedti]
MTYASQTSEQEWTDLVSVASLRGNVEHQQPPSSTTAKQSLSYMYFVALYCWGSDNLQNGQCSSSAAHIFGEMSAKIPAPGSSSVHEHSSNPSMVATCSASQINWCMSAVTSTVPEVIKMQLTDFSTQNATPEQREIETIFGKE